MKSAVVDTNVGVVANGRETDASPECIIFCTDFLEGVSRGEVRLVLDAEWEILSEYLRQLNSSGQPGVGDAFLKWVLQNQANPERCERVEIHPSGDSRGYEELPEDPDLEGFDPSDRKFAAVALAASSRPPIVNAVDSDWWGHRKALERCGLRIKNLCPDVIDEWKRER